VILLRIGIGLAAGDAVGDVPTFGRNLQALAHTTA
jgi:hypothetical protein